MCPVKGCEFVEHRSSADLGLVSLGVSCGFDFDFYLKKNGSKTVAFLGVNNLTCYMHISMHGVIFYSVCWFHLRVIFIYFLDLFGIGIPSIEIISQGGSE